MRCPLTRYGMPQAIVWPSIGAAAAVAFAVSIGGPLGWTFAGAFALLTIWAVTFFRDPDRPLPQDPRAVVAPADGLVVEVTDVDDDPIVTEPAVRIGVFLSVFDVHVNRSPLRGVVVSQQHRPGKYLNALRAASAAENEAWHVALRAEPGEFPVRVTQIAGTIARRIVCRLTDGDSIDRGERYGMIKFGSRTEVVLPRGVVETVTVKVGDRVKGGRDTVARLTAEALESPERDNGNEAERQVAGERSSW